jgi:ribosomal protein S18 acetylase RimI-like enzyme
VTAVHAIRPLAASDLPDAVRLLGSLNPETPLPLISERLETILREHPHYQIFGAFDGGCLAGVCGAWIATKLWCGRYLEIDNLVVAPGERSAGIGTRLIEHLQAIGRGRGCNLIVLDAYTSNHASHRLYHRLGFEIWGFHFIKPIGDWSGKGGG